MSRSYINPEHGLRLFDVFDTVEHAITSFSGQAETVGAPPVLLPSDYLR